MPRPKQPHPKRLTGPTIVPLRTNWPCNECGYGHRASEDDPCLICTSSAGMPFRYDQIPIQVASDALHTSHATSTCAWCGEPTDCARGTSVWEATRLVRVFCSARCQVFHGLRVTVRAVLAVHPTCLE